VYGLSWSESSLCGKFLLMGKGGSLQYFLGIDIGTYESKGCLINEKLEVIKTATISHELSIPKPGWAEHDAEKIWWADFVRLCHKLLDQRTRKRVAAVGCSAIAPTMLPVDHHGIPLRPAILYGIDTRARCEIADLEKILGLEYIKERCWNTLSSQSVGPKILWFKKAEPDLYAKTWKIMTATSYLVFKLTDEVVIDFYTASAFTPLFDLNKLRWIEDLADLLVSPATLPEPRWTGEIAGKVTKEAASVTGILEGTPVLVGTADAAAEFVSVGAGVPGDLMVMLGSTTFFIEQLSFPVRADPLWSSVFLWPGTFCIAGGMATGGALTRWFRDNFAAEELDMERKTGINAYEILWKQATTIPAGSSGLLVLPYFSGERTPINDPAARGVIIGLTLFHGRPHIYRAILEGISFGIRHNLEYIEKIMPPSRVLVIGGGTKNPLWLSIMATVTNKTLLVPPVRVGASYGDALLAAMASGVIRQNDLPRIFQGLYEHVDPNHDLLTTYNLYYSVYRGVWEDIKKWVHKLAEMEGRSGDGFGGSVKGTGRPCSS